MGSPAPARNVLCRERSVNASSRFRVHSGCMQHAVMTADGHSEDVRMLAEVTNLVNRSSNTGACPNLTRSIPVCLTSGQHADMLALATTRRRACDTLQPGILFDV